VGDRLAGRGVRRVYAAIVTHSHYDHWGGLERMIDNGSVTVDRVYEYAEPADDPAYGRFRRKLAAKGIPLLPLLAGGRVPLPDRAVRLDVIGPRHSYSETESDSANRSLVLRLAYGDFSILFAGDAHARAEMDAMEGAEELDSTVLKVANHGNRASSVSPFLDAVRPNLAVVSVEYPNPFGAPHDETLGKLIDRGIDYYRTDLDGDVIVLSDGETWTAWTER
jgi:competence protein ComEC